MKEMIPQVERLLRRVEEQGWACRIVPIDHLTELQETIWNLYQQRLLDNALYDEHLSSFSVSYLPYLASAHSMIIVAVPTPPVRIFFNWQGHRIPVLIPPTYVSYTRRTEIVQDALAEWLKLDGFQLTRPHLPLKTLAVRSGLAYYGRNNICFVPGLGSFLQLVGAFSELPCEDDPWRLPIELPRCKTCTACMKHCPTGAITADRFLIHAERCLTYYNEATDDFPNWIQPSWHHCLFGCMQCQTACPENKPLINWFEDRGEFSEEETALLLQRVSLDQFPAETVSKIKSLELNENYTILCRNLSMLIAQEN